MISIFLAIGLYVQSVSSHFVSVDFVGFFAKEFEDQRYVAILAHGNARGRKAHLTVFEVLDDGKKLRKLREQDLLTDCGPQNWFVCGNGRFAVTLDELTSNPEEGKSIVIYDLVKDEHTAYCLQEFLSEEQIKTLFRPGANKWYNWFDWRKRHFDSEKMEAYVTPESDYVDKLSPEEPHPIAKGMPFVVIDLNTRKVRIDPDPTEPKSDTRTPSWSGWTCSQDGDTGSPPSMLPKMVRYYDSDGKQISAQRSYRINTETLEYNRVGDNDWVEVEGPPAFCYDWSYSWRPGIWPWGKYPWVPPGWKREWPGEDLFKWPTLPEDWFERLVEPRKEKKER